MKYIKPEVNFNKVEAKENIASLNDWLVQNDLSDAGITTFIVNS